MIEKKSPDLSLIEYCIATPKILCTNHNIKFGQLNSFLMSGIGSTDDFHFSINNGHLPTIEYGSVEDVIEFAKQRSQVKEHFIKEFRAMFPDWIDEHDENYDDEQYLYFTFEKLSNLFLRSISVGNVLNSNNSINFENKDINDIIDLFGQKMAIYESGIIPDNLILDLKEFCQFQTQYADSKKNFLFSNNITNWYTEVNLFITTKEMEFLFLFQYRNNQ